MKTAAKKGPVHLRFDDEGSVVVTPEDQDRFVMQVRHAVEACHTASVHAQLLEHFANEFLTPLHRWCKERLDKVRSCYVAFLGNHLAVFVIGKTGAYDFDLGEDIAALELALHQRGWSSDIMQIPAGSPEESSAFFDESESLEIHAER